MEILQRRATHRAWSFIGLAAAVLALAVLALGLWPAPLLDVMHASVQNLVQHLLISKL